MALRGVSRPKAGRHVRVIRAGHLQPAQLGFGIKLIEQNGDGFSVVFKTLAREHTLGMLPDKRRGRRPKRQAECSNYFLKHSGLGVDLMKNRDSVFSEIDALRRVRISIEKDAEPLPVFRFDTEEKTVPVPVFHLSPAMFEYKSFIDDSYNLE